MEDKKIAIVHDWLYGGGAEKVVLELHRMFPDAPIYTSYVSKTWQERLDNQVITGYLQKWPFSRLRKFLPLFRQRWFARLNLSEYDIIISSSGNGEAKFVRTNEQQTHICYCHTPTHFYWRHYEQYVRQPGFRPYWLVRLGLKLLLRPLRKRDYQAAQNVDAFIANSTHIQNDIKAYYDRESTVIHPPVEVERFKGVSGAKRHGFITVGRHTPYKRVDIIVKACTELGVDLTVVGQGPEQKNLQKLAGPTITFLPYTEGDELVRLFAGAEGFLFASYEDFGIAPVEAQSAGTPVVAYKAGGALDYVVEGETGLFFAEQSADSLADTLRKFEKMKWDHTAIAEHATQFSEESFKGKLHNYIETHIAKV